jgi:hypothetical protein
MIIAELTLPRRRLRRTYKIHQKLFLHEQEEMIKIE